MQHHLRNKNKYQPLHHLHDEQTNNDRLAPFDGEHQLPLAIQLPNVSSTPGARRRPRGRTRTNCNNQNSPSNIQNNSNKVAASILPPTATLCAPIRSQHSLQLTYQISRISAPQLSASHSLIDDTRQLGPSTGENVATSTKCKLRSPLRRLFPNRPNHAHQNSAKKSSLVPSLWRHRFSIIEPSLGPLPLLLVLHLSLFLVPFLSAALSSDDNYGSSSANYAQAAASNRPASVNAEGELSATATTTPTLTSTTTTTAFNENITPQEQTFSVWWNEYWSRKPFPSGYTQSSITMLACFISTIIFLIVVGNLLVCIAIFTEKSLKPTQNWFIASLAVSDMLLGAVVMPFSLARELMGFWVFGAMWCDIHEAMDVLLTTASINTLCLISLDRYWSITQAVSYLKKRTPRRGAAMIAFVWLFSAGVSLPPLFGWKKQSPNDIVDQTNQSAPKVDSPDGEQQAASNNNNNNTSEYSSSGESAGLTEGVEPQSGQNQGQNDQEMGSDGDQRHRRRRHYHHHHHSIMAEKYKDLMKLDGEGMATPSLRGRLLGPPQVGALTNPIDTPTGRWARDAAAQQGPALLASPAPVYPTCQLSDDLGYVLYSALGSFYLPCAVMVFTYIKIFLAARSRARRAINKATSRAAAGKAGANTHSLAAHVRRQLEVGGPGRLAGAALESGANASGSVLRSNLSSDLSRQPGVNEAISTPNEPPKAGKIVIVERKRESTAGGVPGESGRASVVALGPSPMSADIARRTSVSPSDERRKLNSATYSCSELLTKASGSIAVGRLSNNTDTPPTATTAHSDSPSDENPDDTASSSITVMRADGRQPPQVTRFSFRRPVTQVKPEVTPPTQEDLEHAEEERRKTASLLQAISEAGMAADSQLLKSIASASSSSSTASHSSPVSSPASGSGSGSPSGSASGSRTNSACATDSATCSPSNRCHAIGCRKLNSSERPNPQQHLEELSTSDGQNKDDKNSKSKQSSEPPATNETCFMNIEEDSDMFDEQCGRTLMMVAGDTGSGHDRARSSSLVAANPKSQAIMVTMKPAARERVDEPSRCRHSRCNRGVPEPSSSYCGSSLSDLDDNDTGNSNRRRHKGHQARGNSQRGRLSDDFGDSTEYCNGFEHNCSLYQCSPGAGSNSCHEHCQECAGSPCKSSLEAGRTGRRSNRCRDHSTTNTIDFDDDDDDDDDIRGDGNDNNDEIEVDDDDDDDDICGEDELDDEELDDDSCSSSAIANSARQTDVLDATRSHLSSSSKKKLINPSSANPVALAETAANVYKEAMPNGPHKRDRKRSSIGFRLARFGSQAAPASNLTPHQGGLLALANQESQLGGAVTNVGGIFPNTVSAPANRNLKALRQNFFLKLNQLTAKSSTKITNGRPSPSIKSSAPSSGTSYEPSVDYATTSNIHSIDFHHEVTTMGDSDNTVPSDRKLPTEQTAGTDEQHLNRGQGDMMRLLEPGKANQHSGRGITMNSTTPASSLIVASPSDSRVSSKLEEQQSAFQRLKPGRATVAGASGAIAGKAAGPLSRGSTALHSSSTGRAYLASDNERHKRKLAKARERRATLILGLIMAAFITSWMPFFTFYVVRAVCITCRDHISPRIEAFIFWMGYCNSAINPIIYTIFNRDFRKAFRKILFRCL